MDQPTATITGRKRRSLSQYVRREWPKSRILVINHPFRQAEFPALRELARELLDRDLFQVTTAGSFTIDQYSREFPDRLNKGKILSPGRMCLETQFRRRAYLVLGLGSGNLETDRLLDWARAKPEIQAIFLTSNYRFPGAYNLGPVTQRVVAWTDLLELTAAESIVLNLNQKVNQINPLPLVIYDDGLVDRERLREKLAPTRVIFTTDGEEQFLPDDLPRNFHVIDFAKPRHNYLQSPVPGELYLIGNRLGLNQNVRRGTYFYLVTGGRNIADVRELPRLPWWTTVSATFINFYLDREILGEIGSPERSEISRLDREYGLSSLNPVVMLLPIEAIDLTLIKLALEQGVHAAVALPIVAFLRQATQPWITGNGLREDLIGETQLETAIRIYSAINHQIQFPLRMTLKWRTAASEICKTLGLNSDTVIRTFRELGNFMRIIGAEPWRLEPKITTEYFSDFFTRLYPQQVYTMRGNFDQYVGPNNQNFQLRGFPVKESIGQTSSLLFPRLVAPIVENSNIRFSATWGIRTSPYLAPFYRWLEEKRPFRVEKEHGFSRRRIGEIRVTAMKPLQGKLRKIAVEPEALVVEFQPEPLSEGELAPIEELSEKDLVLAEFLSGQREFPYKRLFMPFEASEIKLRVNSLQVPTKLLPRRLYGLPAVEIETSQEQYRELNFATDIYTEEVRLSARVGNFGTAFSQWRARLPEILDWVKGDFSDEALREAMYQIGIKEATQFKISVAAIIYKYCGGQDVLDPCAGWGDRRIAALSLGRNYTGCDPNQALIPGHQAITRDFALPGQISEMIPLPFEAIDFDQRKFDTIFTSPPFHDLEEYSLSPDQSAMKFPDYGDWLGRWYKPVISKMISLLKPGGYLALHAGAYRDSSGVLRKFDLDTLKILKENSGRLELRRVFIVQPRKIPVFIGIKL